MFEKLAGGFFSTSGAAVDAQGKLFFVDHHEQRIYGWSSEEGLTVERDNPLDPVNLAFDGAGDLPVVSSEGRAQWNRLCFQAGHIGREDHFPEAAAPPRHALAHARFCPRIIGTIVNSAIS